MENIYKNTNTMMMNRGYVLVKRDDYITIYKNPIENKPIIVWYYISEKLNIDSIKDFIQILEERKSKHGIIIYYSSITSSSKKVLEHLQNFKIELFCFNELTFNLTKHMYYCPHRKLDKTEADIVKENFGTKLPYLLRSDPVVRYFAFQKNDIIEITRKNKSIAYRIIK